MMTQTPIEVRTASDVDPAVHAVVLAFSRDPVIRWLYPDPHQYLTGFPDFIRAFAGKAFEHETACCVEGCSGAALWLPPGVQPDEEELDGVLQRTISEEARKAVTGIIEQADHYHPSEPHWYLALLGVDPVCQRGGYGTALMKHTLARCDWDRKLAYLESSNPENMSLYQRHRFEVIGEIQVRDAPPIYPMLRQPQ